MTLNETSTLLGSTPADRAVDAATDASLAIIIPAYNEADGIAPVLEQIIAMLSASDLAHWRLIVIDDGSKDRTADAIQRFGDNITLLRHEQNRGYGAALKTGLMACDADLICITDADGTYPTEMIPELVRTLLEGNFDMVVGARSAKAAAAPLIRRPPKWVIGRMVNYVTASKVPDFNSGLRIFRRDVAMRMFRLFPDGFSFTTTITLAMLTNHYRVHYVPIDYHTRVGRSKIRPIRDTLGFLRLLVMIGLYFAPLKVFMPVSAGLFIIAIAWAVFTHLVFGQLADVSTVIIAMTAMQIGGLGLLAELINHRTPNDYQL